MFSPFECGTALPRYSGETILKWEVGAKVKGRLCGLGLLLTPFRSFPRHFIVFREYVVKPFDRIFDG